MRAIIFTTIIFIQIIQHSDSAQSNTNTRKCSLKMERKLLKVELSRLVKNCQKLPAGGKSCHKIPKATNSCRRLAKMVNSWQKLARKFRKCKKKRAEENKIKELKKIEAKNKKGKKTKVKSTHLKGKLERGRHQVNTNS